MDLNCVISRDENIRSDRNYIRLKIGPLNVSIVSVKFHRNSLVWNEKIVQQTKPNLDYFWKGKRNLFWVRSISIRKTYFLLAIQCSCFDLIFLKKKKNTNNLFPINSLLLRGSSIIIIITITITITIITSFRSFLIVCLCN